MVSVVSRGRWPDSAIRAGDPGPLGAGGWGVRTCPRARVSILGATAPARRPGCAGPSRGLRRASDLRRPLASARDDAARASRITHRHCVICGPLARSQDYYGENWRDYSGRFEIGVSAPIATGAAAASFAAHHEAITRATGAEVTLGGPVANGGSAHASAREPRNVPSTALTPEDCAAELGSTACAPGGENGGPVVGNPARTIFFGSSPCSH